MENVLLETSRTIVRLADRDDVPAILDYYIENQDYLKRFEPRKWSEFYTTRYWNEEVKQRWFEFNADVSLKLFMFPKSNPNLIIGSINFANVVRGGFQSCTLGYSLAESEQGQGYMTEALKTAIAYVFNEFNLHRITAAYMPHNQRSGNLLKRLGFQVEGYAYDYIQIDGKWQDHILTSLINPHWKSLDI